MPIPEPLKPYLQSRRFWTDFFKITHPEIGAYYTELQDCTIDILVGDSGYGLSFVLDSFVSCLHLNFISPNSEKRVNIGHDDDAHWMPHALRWEEVKLICEAGRKVDPELAESGILLIFLSRFAPICQGDDVDSIVEMVSAALEVLGVLSRKEIRDILKGYDARDAAFRWEYDDEVAGWRIQQGDDRTVMKRRYSKRETQDEFPFDTWPLMIAEAESIASTAGQDPGAERNVSTKYRLPKQYDFGLRIDMQDKKRPISEGIHIYMYQFLNRILADFDLGRAYMGGGTTRVLPTGGSLRVDFSVYIQIRDDLDAGINLLKEMLRWAGAPQHMTYQDWAFRPTPFDLADKRNEGEPDEVRLEIGRLGTIFMYDGIPRERASFPRSCRNLLKAALDDLPGGEGLDEDGWYSVSMADGEELKASFNRIESFAEQDINTLVLRNPSRKTAEFLYSLMVEGDLVLFPLLVGISTPDPAKYPDRDCPPVRVISSAAELHGILAGGSYKWWSNLDQEGEEIPS